jgi:hypothetical protein
MRKKLFVALPLAAALVTGSALWVHAADKPGIPACSDITSGTATYVPPSWSNPNLPGVGWVNPGTFGFVETLAAPTCPDVQYGIVVLAERPVGGPTVLASQVVPGDGLSNQIAFDLQVTSSPSQDMVCVYLYTVGSTGGTTTTPSNGNPHSQTITSAGATLLDRAPDGQELENYCNPAGPDSGARTYN